MNKARLLKLAGLLEADAKRKRGIKFCLAYWGRTDVANDDTPDAIPINCDTTACAVGLACLSGAFKRAGLRYKITSREGGGGNNFIPMFQGAEGTIAAETFFGVTPRQFNFLFTDGGYDGAILKGADGERLVAKRLRDFAAGKVAPRVFV